MRRLTTILLTTTLAAAAVSAQPQPDPTPEVESDARVVREVVVERDHHPWLVKVRRGFFGISTLDMTTELLHHFEVDAEGGVMVSAVSEGGPADQAGLEVGDILVEIDGEAIESQVDAAMVIGRIEPGTEVYATVVRNGQPQTLEVTVGGHDRSQLPLNRVADAPGAFAVGPGMYKYRFKTGPDDEEVLVFDTESMREAAEQLHERLNSPELRARIEAFSARNSELEVRLQEMERRLEEMGARLAEALTELRSQVGDD